MEIWESCVSYHWGTCKWKKDQCVKDKCPWVDMMFKICVIADKVDNIEKDIASKLDGLCDSSPVELAPPRLIEPDN